VLREGDLASVLENENWNIGDFPNEDTNPQTKFLVEMQESCMQEGGRV
jgi:hypothetical protein